MGNMYKTFLGLALAALVTLPASPCSAETVALLPLINNSKDDDASLVYQQNAVVSVGRVDGCQLVDTEGITAAIDRNFNGKDLPSEAQLKEICQAGGVDVVIAAKLDDLGSRTVKGKYTNRLELKLSGKLVSYNALTGKFYQKGLYPEGTRNADEYSRSDFVQSEFARIVRNTVGKALGNKKVRIEKPKLGW